jgi:hypothetical protein
MPSIAKAQDTFLAKATVALCPEYQLGNVEVSLKYTIGTGTQLHEAEITSSSINSAANTGEFEIVLPADFGATDINVTAYCHSTSFGTSDASNQVSVNNCDRLALIDSDNDGMVDYEEDRDCSNWFSPGDASNPHNVDTDGDGIRDLVEILLGNDPTNPGSSPRPYVLSGGTFDPDGDGNANAVVWRSSNGTWYVRDFVYPDNHLAIQYGLPGDIPFVYNPAGGTSDLGVIRRSPNNQLTWYFRGLGYQNANGSRTNALSFGTFGDNNIILGPWEKPGVTSPAVATMYRDIWSFYVYMSDGTVRHNYWGGKGDLPKVQDYDGDGLLDVAVFRPSDGRNYVIQSSDGLGYIYHFGHQSYDHAFRGDVTGDGTDDISFWEPLTGIFRTLKSDNGFDDDAALSLDPDHYFELQLGLYNVHVPLSWNRQNGITLYTVVDHQLGLRYWRKDNNPKNPPQMLQWGLPGDAQG